MKKLEQFPIEQLEETFKEASIDTQMEVDLICGGVGFDDGPQDQEQLLKELRNKHKTT